MKKIICLILSVALVLSLSLIVPSFAEEANTIPENAVNLAVECEVGCEIGDPDLYPGDSASLENPSWFSAANLTDGIHNVDLPPAPLPTDIELCWYGASKKQETDIIITVELSGPADIYCVKIVPSAFLSGASMPSSYTVNLSEDGENWVQIGEESGLTEAGNTYTEPFEYYTNMKAEYVMVHITRASKIADQNFFYSGIDEIEAWGVAIPKTPKPTTAPTEQPTDAPTDAPKDDTTDAPNDNTTDAPKDDATKAPAEATDGASQSGDKDGKSGVNVGLIIGIAAAVVVVAAAAIGVVVSKKKKK